MTASADRDTSAGTLENPLDLLIVGAGISGIDLAHHVCEAFPRWSWEVHDVHDDLGGTWHTFRYPGIRSDSDMATFGFPFRPWPHESTLGQGEEIKEYIRDAARDCGALERLHLRSWIRCADWNSREQLWQVTSVRGDSGSGSGSASESERTIWTRRVHFGAGYYSHSEGFRPEFPNEEEFTGEIIHPQHWPEDTEYAGRRFVVIGSGATAITLVPALEQLGADVTMLQRTPSYVAPLPEKDIISAVWKRILPASPAYRAARFTHGARDMGQFLVAQNLPWAFKQGLRAMQRRYISRAQVAEHFTPSYRPWDQRVCKAPNGDIFRAMQGNARVVTGHIDTFTERGIQLRSGAELEADVIVTATGLELEAFGGGTLSIDGRALPPSDQTAYRGMMLAGVPNFSFTVGYVNASWTLRADMVSKYMVKLWRAGEKSGEKIYAPVPPEKRGDRPLLDLDAGYVRRGAHRFPRQGTARPWTYVQNYLVEIPELTFGDQRRGMEFGDRITPAAVR
ncbi:NAD(P)/FAD-dependent oxidoreductase [Rhodococcus sp. IEGM 1408]|uniref:flavin-containing monooxygenase n=1 Tax=Rhodococcus sp. IEGM 1408 TaxID=3082220 RepID=UPI002955936C|nr:NAD(P)/FAD-dependent oxidoreductase [Rhodococcus sp. IEGM 1408]MDV8001975.1 NAD(P)/FAD-dependent oxidoreductase [Rhodococcus sp. IEGM 1408]